MKEHLKAAKQYEEKQRERGHRQSKGAVELDAWIKERLAEKKCDSYEEGREQAATLVPCPRALAPSPDREATASITSCCSTGARPPNSAVIVLTGLDA